MKRYLLKLTVYCLLIVYLFSACSAKTAAEIKTEEAPEESTTELSRVRIIDGAETGELLLADNDVYLLSLSESEIPVYLDGKEADASCLRDGMLIDIEHGGDVMESWPAQFGLISAIYAYSIGTEQNPGGRCFDLCGLYLQVLEDLWARDDSLNSGAEYISVDLSDAPGELTETECAAIAYLFASRHGAEALTLGYNELLAQGYLTREGESNAYSWDNGVLLRISAAEDDGVYSLPVIHFAAEKWRSPLGAYYFTDCSASWPQMGTWESYHIGGEAIS